MPLKNPKLGKHSAVTIDKDVQYKGGPFDPGNPRSIVNICPEEMRKALVKLPHFWLYMTEQEIEERVRPSPELCRVRMAFWKEYELAQSTIRQMSLADITKHLGFPSVFLIKSFTRIENLAWILCPPASYDTFLDEALSHGMKQLRKILDLPFITPEGRVDTRTADLVLKAVAFLDLRKNGGIVGKQMNLNVESSPRQMRAITAQAQMEDIDAKIAELEAKHSLDAARDEIGVVEVPQIEYGPTDRLMQEIKAFGESELEEVDDGRDFSQATRTGRNKKT